MAVATLVLVATVAFALVDWLLVVGHRECPLGLELERSSSTVLAERAVPPRVECRYLYEESGGGELHPPEVVVYDAAPTAAAAAGAGAVWLALLGLWLRSRRVDGAD